MKSSRRQFLSTTSTLALGAPFIVASCTHTASHRRLPGDRINLGFIGMGTMARGHLGAFLANRETQVVAVCDVHNERLQHAVQTVHQAYAKEKDSGSYRGCGAYADFRQLLHRPDIDAVVISTPDHWHAIPAIEACRAGKDVYCEKPLSLTLGEGRAMVKAARSHGTVFQTGSQQRTEFGGRFRTAVEVVRSGRLGRVRTVRVGVGGPCRPCDLPTEPEPADVHWDLWLGPAPFRGYNQILCPQGIHRHYPAWRNYREYAGGALADMGAHHFDIAQWALGMDASGPVEIIPPSDPMAETGLLFRYGNGVEMFHGGPSGVTFEGTNGTLHVDRDRISSNPGTILSDPLGEKDYRLPNVGTDHKKHWLVCIRSRQRPNADVSIGARTAAICHLGNLGYQLRRPLRWDPARERFVGDAEANSLINRPRRTPWKV